MPNIPGIIGYTKPGAYSNVRTKVGSVSVSGGPTVICIMGVGQREETLVASATGGGADGEPAQFDSRLDPDGRYFQVSTYPIISGQFDLWLNYQGDGTDTPLVRVSSATEGSLWQDEFGTSHTYGFPDVGEAADGYGTEGAGLIDEADYGLDSYKHASDGTGFFDEGYGKRWGYTDALTSGTAEPQHYYLDETYGHIVLDYPLSQYDSLIATFIAEDDVNDPELFYDPDELYTKHGYPSTDNTLALAAQIAWENGAKGIMAVHAGLTENTSGVWVNDPYWSDAFEALKKENVDIIVPIQRTFVKNEVIMPFYSETTYASLTGNGTYLQEVAGGGDEPGINIYPLESEDGINPDYLKVYHNSTLLVYNIDYTVSNVTGPDPVKITFTSTFNSGAGRMTLGDKVVVDYRPDMDLIATVQAACKAHCRLMSSVKQRKERWFITGAYDGMTRTVMLDDTYGVDANFGDTFRAMYFAPERIRRVVNGETAYLDGIYMAAAAGGWFSAQDYLAEPLTFKSLIGFDIENAQKYTVDEADLLASDGITIVEPLASGGRVRHGLTTTNSGSSEEEEPSILRVRDYVAKQSRTTLENRFVGGVITSTTLGEVKITQEKLLDAFVSQRLISQYASIQVTQDSTEPRQVNVAFDIQPVYPLNWIRIDFSIGLL